MPVFDALKRMAGDVKYIDPRYIKGGPVPDEVVEPMLEHPALVELVKALEERVIAAEDRLAVLEKPAKP